MHLSADISILDLVTQASTLVQIVMGLLLLASIISWAIIFSKRRLFSKSQKAMRHFESLFWSGGNIDDIYRQTRQNDSQASLIGLFNAGYEELSRQRRQPEQDTGETTLAVHRAMRVQLSRNLEQMESGLPTLATIGSTSPYVGLFGTVWGIMNAFIALGDVQQASLQMVAPGIAEALVATAMGLFAAIPAVIAFNQFSTRVDRFENRYQTFIEEMLGIIEYGLKQRRDSSSADRVKTQKQSAAI